MNVFPTFESYRKAWVDAYTQDPPVPLNVDIELASVCNLKCPMCFYGEAEWNAAMMQPAPDGKPKKRLMPTEMAIKIIDQCAEIGVPALKMNWRGESTIHPDYSKILTYAAQRTTFHYQEHMELGGWGVHLKSFHEILVNTNANCKDHAIPGLMAATKCMVSLDSTIPEIYAIQRAGGDLNRAIEVVKELIKRKHPNLWIRRVMTKENAHEPFAENVHKIFGGKGYKVSEHHCVDRSTDSTHQTNNPDKYERTYCGYPSQRLMVASDGTCYPCCVDYDGTMEMGSVQESSLLDIWNGDRFKRLRSDLRRNQFQSEACKKCTSWMAYKAPQREQVQDKEVILK